MVPVGILNFSGLPNGDYINAPFGYGDHELYEPDADKFVLFGRSNNVAVGIASLLPGG